MCIKCISKQSTAETYQTKVDREWAYAKNGKDDEHYTKAREAYAKEYREKAERLKNE